MTQAILLAASGAALGVYISEAIKVYTLLEFLNILNELCPLRYEIIPFPEDKGIIDIGDYYGDYTGLGHRWNPN